VGESGTGLEAGGEIGAEGVAGGGKALADAGGAEVGLDLFADLGELGDSGRDGFAPDEDDGLVRANEGVGVGLAFAESLGGGGELAHVGERGGGAGGGDEAGGFDREAAFGDEVGECVEGDLVFEEGEGKVAGGLAGVAHGFLAADGGLDLGFDEVELVEFAFGGGGLVGLGSGEARGVGEVGGEELVVADGDRGRVGGEGDVIDVHLRGDFVASGVVGEEGGEVGVGQLDFGGEFGGVDGGDVDGPGGFAEGELFGDI